MSRIKGKTITLYVKQKTGIDGYNAPVYTETAVSVDNVLIEPASNDAIVQDNQMLGKHLAYILHIPKGDINDWKDVTVEFNGSKWKTYGDCLVYDEDMTPLSWNKKVKVERFE